MAISPYSTPLQYEYKPLNLSGFMIPLAEMQKQFDDTTAAIDEATFNINSLPYGTDPEKAKELKKLVESKTDELAKNLATSKNYRQAASKLKEINNLWNNDPHKLALEGEAKRWEEAKKRELARINNGKKDSLTREQYLQWEADEIRNYEAKGGASFKADYSNEKGTYNKITGDTGRLADKTEELRELSMKAAAAMKGDATEGYYKSIGIDYDTFHKHFAKKNIEKLTTEEIAHDVRNFLLTQPDFKDWGLEVADYNFKDFQYSKNYNDYAKKIVDTQKESIDDRLDNRKKVLAQNKKSEKDDETYQSLLKEKQELEKIQTSGDYNPDKIKNIYTQQHLSDLFNMNTIGDLYEYSKISTEEKGEKIDKDSELGAGLGMGQKDKPAPVFFDNQDMPITVDSTKKMMYNNATKLFNYNKQGLNLSDGTLRTVILGKPIGDSSVSKGIAKGVGSEREKKSKDIVYQQEALRTLQKAAVSNVGNYKGFKKMLSDGGLDVSDDKAVKRLFDDFATPGSKGLRELSTVIENSQEDYENYQINKSNLKLVEKATYKDADYKLITANIANKSGFVLFDSKASLPAGVSIDNSELHYLFDPKNYSKDELKTKGINTNKSNLTFNDVAKLKGYKNYDDAVQKGYNFGNVSTSTSVNGKSYLGTPQQIKTQIMKDVAAKGLSVEKMSYDLINDSYSASTLKKEFNTIQNVASYAYEKSFAGKEGFDEKGNPLPGTNVSYSSTKTPLITTMNGTTYFKVPYKYTVDGKSKEGSLTFKAKPTTTKWLNDVYDKVADKASKLDTEVGKETYETVKVAQYNLKYGSDFNDVIAKSYPVTTKKPEVEIRTINMPDPNSNNVLSVKIVKQKANNGSNQEVFRLKFPNNSYSQEFDSPEALKVAVMEYLR